MERWAWEREGTGFDVMHSFPSHTLLPMAFNKKRAENKMITTPLFLYTSDYV